MKICLISDLYDPYIIGGAELYVQRIANKLAQRHEVAIITERPFSGLSSLKSSLGIKDNVKIYRFYPLNVYFTYSAATAPATFKPLFHFFNLWNLHSYIMVREILSREEPEIVHTHNLGGLSPSVFSAIRSVDCPHVHTLHDYALISPWAILYRNGKLLEQFNRLDRLYMKFKRALSSQADVVLGPSQFILDMHSQNGYFHNSKLIKLPIGVEGTSNREIHKNHEGRNILYVGNLSTHKGVHVLIKAFRQLMGSNLKLHIVGTGPNLSQLQQLAEGDPRIRFYGFLSGNELQELYERATILVVPSLCFENCPTVVMESFKYGTPVIGSDIGGIPELVQRGYNGLLFKAGDADQLRDILSVLIGNLAELKMMRKGALDSAGQYDLDKHVTKLEEIYQRLLSEKGSR